MVSSNSGGDNSENTISRSRWRHKAPGEQSSPCLFSGNQSVSQVGQKVREGRGFFAKSTSTVVPLAKPSALLMQPRAEGSVGLTDTYVIQQHRPGWDCRQNSKPVHRTISSELKYSLSSASTSGHLYHDLANGMCTISRMTLLPPRPMARSRKAWISFILYHN